MSRLVRLSALLVLAAACGETTNLAPQQLNLDRPRDITFGCWGGMRVTEGRTTPELTDPITLEAQPTTACDIRSGDRIDGQVPVPPGQESLTAMGGEPVLGANWFAFILQSGPGTVAIARFETKPATAFTGSDINVLDVDPLTPGKNSISVGEDPIAIATDTAGCKVVTANAGSCDLSVLDISSAVDTNVGTPIDVQRVTVHNATGEEIRAKPAALVAEPPIREYGKTCAETATGLMYVAYPSCHMVAAVDVATGNIVQHVRFDADGIATLIPDGNVSCPDECSGGAAPVAGTRPVTLDLQRDERTDVRRLVIGADNSASITIVELDETTTLPESLRQVALEDPDGTLGITAITLSPQIGMGGTTSVVNDMGPGGQFVFVYAVATDHSVRVADILSLDKECDTQVDPRFLRDVNSVRSLSCMPVGDAATPPRRAGARGPGIQLVGDGVPISVAVVKSTEVAGNSTIAAPETLIGYFGVITATNGANFLFNVDDDNFPDLFSDRDPLATPMPLVLPHQLRDGIPFRDLKAVEACPDMMACPDVPICDEFSPSDDPNTLIGGPRLTTLPSRNAPATVYAPEKVFALPTLRQLKCVGADNVPSIISELGFQAPEGVRDTVFPDLTALRADELWVMTWEGSVSNDASNSDIDGPQIRESQIFVDSTGMRIEDKTRPFCNAGAQPFDFVQLRGCDPSVGNSDCPTGYRCFVHPDSQVAGIGQCMLDDEADRLAEACRDFLTSFRRYTVGSTKSGELQLLPRKHTLRMTPVEGCASDDQCQTLATYQASNTSSKHPVDETAVDQRTWKCEADANRAAVQTGKRCMLKCDSQADCFAGTICQGGTGNGKLGNCMEGVIPPQACVNAPQRYEIRVGEAFAVVGQRTGFEHATIADASGKCIHDPSAHPLINARIPLTPPPCDPTADPLSGRLPDGSFEPNPCSFTTTQTDIKPVYTEGTCTLASNTGEVVERPDVPAIKYRNRGMNLTIVDPYYGGDAMCILDRGGTLGHIPHVFTGYSIQFRQTAGFSAQLIRATPAFPVKVVRGPTNSIWIIDEGDTLSQSINQPSTRGRVFQVVPSGLGTINTLE